jgi:hypothetical protein
MLPQSYRKLDGFDCSVESRFPRFVDQQMNMLRITT